jgi:hypothetical protein
MQWDVEIRTNERCEQTQNDLMQVVANAARLAQPEFYFQRKLRQMVRALQWNENPFTCLSPLERSHLKLFLFDGAGKRVIRDGFTVGFVSASEQCLAMMKAAVREPGIQPGQKESRLLTSFLGSTKLLDQVSQNLGMFSGTGEIGIERMVGLFPYRCHRGKKGFLLGIVERKDIPEGILVEKTLENVQRRLGRDYRFGMRDLTGRIATRLFGTHEFPSRVASEPMTIGLNRTFQQDGRFLCVSLVERRYQIFGSCPVPPAFEPPVRNSLLVCGALVLAGILGQLAGRVFIPIRLQVIGLFGIAGVGGLVTLLGFAQTYLLTCRETLIRQSFERARDSMEKADAQFLAYQHRKAIQLRPIMAAIKSVPTDLGLVKKHLGHLQSLNKLVAGFLIGDKGEIFWSHEPEHRYSLRALFGKECVSVVKKICGGAMNLHNRNMDGIPAGFSAQSGGLEHELFVREMGEKIFPMRGNILWTHLGKSAIPLFFDIAFDSRGRAISSLFVTFENRCLEQSFFRRWRTMMKKSPEVSQDLFLPVTIGEPLAKTKLGAFASAHFELQELRKLVTRTMSPGYCIGGDPRNPVLITGYPAKNVEQTTFFLLSFLRPIERQFQALETRFYFFGFLFWGFTIALGWIASRFFVQPLHEIGRSVNDLIASRFRSPPALKTGDVMEDIAQGIKGIMDELGELATARQVHEQLFPHKPLCCGGYFGQGWFLARSDLGGEIFDHHEMKGGGRLAFWMAEIRGGKIESALRLAMSKMALRLLLEQPDLKPSGVIEELRRMFFVNPEAFQDVSIALGIIEQQTGDISFCLKGKCVVARQDIAGESPWIIALTHDGHPHLGEYQMTLLVAQRIVMFSPGWFALPRVSTKELWQPALTKLLSHQVQTPSSEFGERVFAAPKDSVSEFSAAESRSMVVFERRNPP